MIFSIFALSVLMVLMLGARIYKNMTDMTREGQDERTLLSYIWTKVKNSDKAGSIYVGEFCELSALCIDEIYDGTLYRTVVYQYDGWVYELFSETGIEFLPEDGVKVMRIDDLKFEEAEYGLLKVTTGEKSLLISPRTGYSNAGEVGMLFDEGGNPL